MTPAVDTRPAVCGVTIYSSRPDVLASYYAQVLATPLDGGVDHLSGEAMYRTQLHGLEFEVIGTSAAVGTGAVQPSVQVDDVTGAVQRALAADGSIHLAAAEYEWGSFAVVSDPDGNRLGLFTPVHTTSSSDTEKGKA